MSLDKQIMLFKETVENYLPQHFKNAEEISHYLSSSIFAILIGNNDYLGNYLQPDYNSATSRCSREEFANLLISVLERQLKVLENFISPNTRKCFVFRKQKIVHSIEATSKFFPLIRRIYTILELGRY